MKLTKNMIIGIVASGCIVLSFIVLACLIMFIPPSLFFKNPSAGSDATTPNGMQPLSQGVVLDLTVDLTDSTRPVLIGVTNLPDGTDIITAVEGQTTNWLGQDITKVIDGRFNSGPFATRTGLPAGVYHARATMPVANVQPPSVRAIIGQNGENLRGPLVQPAFGSVVVIVETQFQVK